MKSKKLIKSVQKDQQVIRVTTTFEPIYFINSMKSLGFSGLQASVKYVDPIKPMPDDIVVQVKAIKLDYVRDFFCMR